ncbi:MAG: crotonobetainyl-CoA:carnitine CoA-transferase CaiB-like acyl-CoA transferase [Alphaproteobacteria bacterium]
MNNTNGIKMTAQPEKPLPLSGVRVIEFCQTIMGPCAGLILADLGADVIKLEPAPDGDKTRRLHGFAAGFFGAFNRNKRSLALNLKTDEGRALAHQLIESADVVIENYAPGTMEKLGCGRDDMMKLNPRLIYCALKGFLSGPYEDRPALDEVVQYMAGLAYMTGPPGQPLRAGSSVIDIMGGMFAVIGIQSALRDRESTGKGQFVKSALFEATSFLMMQHMVAEAVTGVEPPPMPIRRGAWAVYETFETSDGERIFIGLTSDNHWRRFCERFERPELLNDPELKTNEDRVVARPRVLPVVEEVVKQYTIAEMSRIAEEIEIPFSPVARPRDLFDDPQLNANGRMLNVELNEDVTSRVPRLPVEIGDHDLRLRRQPPKIGEHSREILSEIGVSEEQLAALAKQRIVIDPN